MTAPAPYPYRPIMTAPIDGTLIRACHGNPGRISFYWVVFEDGSWRDHYTKEIVAPTHWRVGT